MENKYYTQYKGWWYMYIPTIDPVNGINTWRLANRRNEMDWVFIFNADLLRIDQCIEKAIKTSTRTWNNEFFEDHGTR